MCQNFLNPVGPIASIVLLFFYIISSYKIEYIDAIVKIWKYHPIFNISSTQKKKDMKNIFFLILKIVIHFVIAHSLIHIVKLFLEDAIQFN